MLLLCVYIDCCQKLSCALLILSSELNSQVNIFTAYFCLISDCPYFTCINFSELATITLKPKGVA